MGGCSDTVRQITPEQWRWIKLILLIVVIITVSALIYAYRDDIFDAIRSVAGWMRDAKFGGVMIIVGWSFVTSFPPVPLRETGMRLAGYVWGVPWGFLIAFSGSMIGSILCFLLGRYLLHERVIKWIAGDKYLTAIKHSIALGGLKLIILLRIGPFPFSWMSLFLSATDIDLKTYLWATLVGLQWVWYQVWIGTVLDNVEAAANLDFSADSTKVNIAVVFVSAIVSMIAMYYIKRVVEQILAKDAARVIESKNEEGLVPLSDVVTTIPITELEMPEGFARRFTPPSHALWTAHMQPKLDVPSSSSIEEKKDEKKQPEQQNNKKTGSPGPSNGEVVSLQDSTGGFISGSLVDLEMVAKAVASARRASQEEIVQRKKSTAVEEQRKKSSATTTSPTTTITAIDENAQTNTSSRGRVSSVSKKTPEERVRTITTNE